MGAMNTGRISGTRAGRSRYTAAGPVLAAVALALLTGACSQVPDAVNPVAWAESVTGGSSTEPKEDAQNDLQAQRGTPPPGSDESYGSLGNVDRQLAARQAQQSGLSADVQGRNYADSVQRQGGQAENSLYPNDKPPAAPNVQSQAPAPAAQPSAPVSSAPTLRAPAPQSTAAAPSAGAQQDTGGGYVDPGMAERLAQQLAEIRARAADRGSLLPSDLTSGGQGQPTIIVSSGGIETTQVSGMQSQAPVEVAGLPAASYDGTNTVSNQGALPIPADATRVATIRFTNGSASLDSNDRQILANVAKLQKQNNGTLRIVGHASQRTRNMDPVLHKMANFKVSLSRAETVVGELQRMGVASDRILTAAVGDNSPAYLEVMPSGEAGNRRTEIYLSN